MFFLKNLPPPIPDAQDKTPPESPSLDSLFLTPHPHSASPLPKYTRSLEASQKLPCLHHSHCPSSGPGSCLLARLLASTPAPPSSVPPHDCHTVFLKDKANDIGTQLKTLQHTTPHPYQGPGMGEAILFSNRITRLNPCLRAAQPKICGTLPPPPKKCPTLSTLIPKWSPSAPLEKEG